MTRSIWAPVAPAQRQTAVPVTPVQGVDVSNWQGALTSALITQLKGQGCRFFVVQAVTDNLGNSFTRQQLRAAADAGLEIEGYIWCFPGDTEASITSRLHLFDGFPIGRLWLDVEQVGVTVADVNLALSLGDAYIGGTTHIYSRQSFFVAQGWASQALWSNRLLWDAHYDGQPDVDANFQAYGGWEACELKQYQNAPLDWNVRRGVTETVPGPVQ